jgi:hypothetical protein
MWTVLLAWHFFHKRTESDVFPVRMGGGTEDILEGEQHHSMRSSRTEAITQCNNSKLSKFAGPSWPIKCKIC